MDARWPDPLSNKYGSRFAGTLTEFALRHCMQSCSHSFQSTAARIRSDFAQVGERKRQTLHEMIEGVSRTSDSRIQRLEAAGADPKKIALLTQAWRAAEQHGLEIDGQTGHIKGGLAQVDKVLA
jgi:hypothetical protein